VDDLHTDLTQARANMQHVEAEVLWWLTAAAVVVTVLFAWGALGQASLLAHGWEWRRGT
jgi:hypothetical protein